MSTLPELIEAEWTKDLTALRKAGWRVVAHHDRGKEGLLFSTAWAFEREGRYMETSAGSDAVAVYLAFCKAELYEAPVAHCPWCGRKLVQYDTGISCHQCSAYFEKSRWWRTCCDEYHGHGFGCLAESKPPDPSAPPRG